MQMYANMKREDNHEKTQGLVNVGDTRLKRERGTSLVESMLDGYRGLTERCFRGMGMDSSNYNGETIKALRFPRN